MIVKDISGVYKLHDGNDPMGMVGLTVLPKNLSINRGRMSAKGAFTRENPDRSLDVMLAKGGLIEDHRKNPTVHIQHKKSVPIGRACDPLGAYTVKMCSDGLGWEGETYFSQHTQEGEDAFRLVETKVLCGLSPGFMPVMGQLEKSYAGGVLYKQWKLVEYSHVYIPDHQDCLVDVIYKGFSGGKRLCPSLDAIFRPMCPVPNEMVTSGWDADAITKGGTGGGSGTYANAEARMIKPLHRDSEYFVCPHCEKEITRKHIYEDADNKIRHGDCQGEVTFQQPEPPPVDVGVTHTIPKSLTGWREKMYEDDPYATDVADPNDPNAVDPNAAANDTESHWLGIASSMLQEALDGDDGALKRLKILIDTKRKLTDAGVTSDMPDVMGDSDDDGDSADEDTDFDGETDGPPKKKGKSLMVFRNEDAAILTKGYKLASSILVTKNLSREKLDPLLREWLDELETVAPVKVAIVTKSLKTRAKPIAEPSADAIAAEWKAYWDEQNAPVN